MYRFVFAGLLLWASAAQAQHTLSGSVRDVKDSKALAGATIQDAQGISTVADEFGWFRLDKLTPGEHILTIKFLGYADKQQTVRIPEQGNVSINLEETSTMTEAVVVQATRANEKTPTTFVTLSRPAIQKQNFGQDLPFILNWTPSVVTTSDAGAGVGYTGIRIRGSDATRVNVTINGIPYNDSESQGTFWVDIPDIASSTQSIQIQRGVGTSTNGGSAFGATVNLQTNSLQSEPYAEMLLGGGSFHTRRSTLRAGTGLINNHWAFDAKVSRITSDGFVERASSDLSSYYLSGGYYGKKTVIKAITFGGHEKTYQSWYGVDSATLQTNRRMNYAGAIYNPDGTIARYYDNQVDDYNQDHYQLHISQQLGSRWNANVSLHYTMGKGYYEEYHQGQSFQSLGLPDVTLKDTILTGSDVIVRQWLDNKFYGATYAAHYATERTNLVLGGAYNQYAQARHFGEIIWAEYAQVPIRHKYYEGNSQKNDFNTYGKWNYQLARNLNTFVDIQYRKVDYQTSGIRDDQSAYAVNETFNFVNPKWGLSYSLSERSVVYASYAIAHREPNRSDYIDGSVKPRPERLGNLEIGWRRTANRYGFEANYYYMGYTDQLVLTGRLDNGGYPIRTNVGSSFRTGIELSGMAQLSKVWTWSANTTLSVNQNRDFQTLEGNIPVVRNTAIVLSPGLIAGSQLSWSGIAHLQITWLSKYVGKQFLDNTQHERLALAGYFVNDLRFSYLITPKTVKEIGLSVLLNNVMDVKYASNGYTYGNAAYYYPQAGRNLMVMMTLKF